jgi:hypothetical protein
MAFAVPIGVYGMSAVAPGLGGAILNALAWTSIPTAAFIVVREDAIIKNRKKKELKIHKEKELKREKKEIESMGIEDKYSSDLRVYKNRLLKVKNIQRYIKGSQTKIAKSLKKRAFKVLKGVWKMVSEVQFKGTGDLLSNWSFETHNHITFDNISINPSLIGIINSDNNPNK